MNSDNGVKIGSFGEKIYPPIFISSGSAKSASGSTSSYDQASQQLTKSNNNTATTASNDQNTTRRMMTGNDQAVLMKNGRERLRTFTEGRWPVSAHQSPVDLSEAGFFYLHDQDRVQCAFCKGVIKNWIRGDVPIREHAKHFPRCPFVIGYNVGNIPISEDPIRGPHPILLSYDVCGNFNSSSGRQDPMPSPMSVDESSGSDDELQHLDRYDPISDPEESSGNSIGSRSTSSSTANHGIIQRVDPVSPQMAAPGARLATYRNSRWPVNCPMEPQELSEAGLYYIGEQDYVRCFHCGGGLCGWEPGDNAWSEHRRLYPNCQFAMLNAPLAPTIGSGESGIGSSSEDDDELNRERVDITLESWLASDMVKNFLENYNYSRLVVKNVLRQRYFDVGRPFSDVAELHAAVNNASQNLLSLGSQSTQLTTSSQESAYSISPRSSDEERDMRCVCKICLDREVGIVFLPCGHHAACTLCGPAVHKCPICRTPIQQYIRSFLA